MERKKFFSIVIVILVSIILLIGIYKLIIYNLKLNEGKFKINDAILSCTTDVISKTEENGYLSFDASQRNTISLQIISLDKSKIANININNIVLTGKLSNIYLNQKDREEVLASDIETLPIDIQYEKDGSILIELDIVNKNIVMNKELPKGIETLRYDAKVLKDIGINIEDIQFNIAFDLNVIGEDGVKNTLKIDKKLPRKEMLEQGYYVERMEAGELVFKINK